MGLSSKSDMCNLGLSLLGNYGTVSSLDTPTNDRERTCAKWYDLCRRFTLKFMMPNFAITRTVTSKLDATPPFGYYYYYERPNLCLKILGVGETYQKFNDNALEEDKILHDTNYEDGMPIRWVKDITDINQFSPEYMLVLAEYIAAYTCKEVTQDPQLAKSLMESLPAKISLASGLNAQESPPIRINNSRFKQARYSDYPSISSKR